MRILPIASGSSGNSIYIGDDTTHILIDAGMSKKRIEEGLAQAGISAGELDAIFVTHEHADHISGLGVLTRKYDVPIYASMGTIQGILNAKSVGDIPQDLFQRVQRNENVTVGSLTIKAIPISHDAADPLCYRVSNGAKSIAVATDIGCVQDHLIENLRGLDALLLEANHDINMLQVGPYPYYLKRRILGDKGHLSNEASGRLLANLLHDDIRHIFLGHLSKENNMPELALEAVRLEVNMADNPYQSSDFPIEVALRGEPTRLICV